MVTAMPRRDIAAETQPEYEYAALRALGRAPGPLGAGALAEALRGLGYAVSMATAGRILWRLDRRGYTARCGNRGRVLSETGKLRLAEMERLSKREALSREFLGELDAQGPRKLLDMLVARRAVERETARLAALHADGDDLAEIGIFAEILDGRKESDIQAEIIDRRFHEAVARAGKNTLLAAALSLFRQDAELSQVLTNIRRHGKSPLGGYHGPIAAAIAARDPERAEQAMLAHIDAIIEEMRQFFRENPEEGERPAHRRVCAPPARFFTPKEGIDTDENNKH